MKTAKVDKQAAPLRQDHPVVKFRGRMIPILGTVGGTAEQSRETAKNIEAFVANVQPKARKG